MNRTAQQHTLQPTDATAEYDIPEGWASVQLKDHVYIAGRIGWRGLKRSEYTQAGPLFLAVKDILPDGRIDFTQTEHLSKARYDESPEIQVQPNDLLLTKDGTIGKVGMVKTLPGEVTVNSSILVVRPTNALITNRYLFHFLRGPQFQEIAQARIAGSAVPHLFQKDIRELTALVPPIPEQKRIVAKIEELLVQVNSVRARLTKVSHILKRFRRAVLAAACSGQLTEEWRAAEGIDTDEWTQTTLDKVADMRLGKMLDKSKNTGTPTRYVRNINVRWFSFDLNDVALMRVTPEERKELEIKNGDLLVCEGGEPGRCAVWNLGPTDLVFQKAIHRIRLAKEILPDWVAFNVKNDADSGALEDYYTGSTIKHLTGRSLASYTFAYPSIAEQLEAVRRVEALFKLADSIEKSVAKATKRADKLTHAILAKAFRGELVPTEAELARREGRDFEPASVLLEGIRTRAQTSQGRISNTRRRKGIDKSKNRS